MSADPRVEISLGDDVAVIGLHGGGIRHLRLGGRDVIPMDTAEARQRWFAGATLAPWPNRLRDATWEFAGRTLTLPMNDERGHALHGLVFDRTFEVLHYTATSVSIAYALGNDSGYPFEVHIGLTYTLTDDGLHCVYRAHNRSGKRVPVALGAHPYFPWVEGCTVRIDADAVCENDERLIPTGRLLEPITVGVQAHTTTPLASVQLDHCFTQLARDAQGTTRTVLAYPDGSSTIMWQDSNFRYLQVYTSRVGMWQDVDAFAVGIEPQTSPADAFHTGTDLDWLDPDAELVARWGIAAVGA